MGLRKARREADLAARLRGVGLRVTSPRLAVLSLLEGKRWHAAAEEIHAALLEAHPSLSLSTVYETLTAFLRAGLLRRVAGGDGLLRVDGTTRDHDHAVCRCCGRIFDVERRGLSLPTPPPRLPRGLSVEGVRLEYEVVCSSCFRGDRRSGGFAENTRERSASARRRPANSKEETKQWRSSRGRRPTRT